MINILAEFEFNTNYINLEKFMEIMGYKYLDHEADVGILAWGTNLEDAFVDGAKALFEIMVKTENVEPRDKIGIQCSAFDIAGLFVEWLNELLTQKDIQDKFFSKFEVEEIKKKGDSYLLKGYAYGEDINLDKHEVKTEVKGATYSGLKHETKEGKHYIQCVVDI